MSPTIVAGTPSSRFSTAVSRCRRPSGGSGSRLLAKSVARTPAACFGSTLPLQGSASTPSLTTFAAAGSGATAATVGKSTQASTGRKSLKQFVGSHGGRRVSGIVDCKAFPTSGHEELVLHGTAASQRMPQRAASAGSSPHGAWKSSSSGGSGKPNHPQNLFPSGRAPFLTKVPTPARGRPGLGASFRKPLPGRSGTTLSAAALFDEVIRRDRTYGPILAEIKDAYETFLRDHGASLPEEPIAAVGLADGDSMASGSRPGGVRKSSERSESAERAVDAARRPWLQPEDATSRGDYYKECELERENVAVRAHIERLRLDLLHAQQTDARTQALLQRGQPSQETPESMLAASVQPGEHPPLHQQSPQHAEAQAAAPAPKPALPIPARVALPIPARAALPIPARGSQVSPPMADGQQSGRWHSARSSTASTISVHSADDGYAARWPLGVWAARQTPPGIEGQIREASRPREVPALDFSRISWLVDEGSESNDEGCYSDFEDEGGGQPEITPPPRFDGDGH